MNVAVSDIARILGGSKVLDREVLALADLRRVIDNGISAESAVCAIREVTSPGDAGQKQAFSSVVFDSAERAADVLDGSDTTQRLSSDESERIERIARIFALAELAMGNKDLARKFMNAPHARLGGLAPLRNLRNEVGAFEVEAILNALLFGLPA